LRSKDLKEEDWARFLDDSWDDAKWEEEMRKRFGEAYYGEEDVDSEVEQAEARSARKKRTIKKPKWDDDIDICDIVPGFVGDEGPAFALSEDETSQSEIEVPKSNATLRSQKPSKGHKTKRRKDKKEFRNERKMIEQLVDKKLEIDTALLGGSLRKGGFRYRETSPVNYGLSATDILLAPDSQLNEYVGLKKLATFRDPEKKRRDRKLLGKKARLRKWRQETFGDEEGLNNANFVHVPQRSLASDDHLADSQDGVDVRGDSDKRRRRKKPKKKS
jgi:protein KRI1